MDMHGSERRANEPRGSRWPALAVGALAAAVALAGCDSLLDVEAPTKVPEETLANPQNAPLLVSSAVADFDCAFGEYIAAAGMMGDELVDSQLAARMWDYDRRSVSRSTAQHDWNCEFPDPGIYQTLSTARFSADNAAQRISGFAQGEVAGRDVLLATAQAYSGYSRLLLGEAYCSAGSLQETDGDLEPGPAVTSGDLFALAENRFTAAIDLAGPAGADSILYMAYVGRARARLNQGNESGALSDARQVVQQAPTDFERAAHFSAQSFRSSNRVWTMNNRDQRMTVEDDFWDLTFNGVPDPRVPVTDQNQLAAADNFSPWWTQDKYAGQATPIPIATYDEAQLIVAEVELGQTAVDIINELHADAGLDSWTPNDVNDDVEVLGHVVEERRRELFLESHHFFDKLRFRQKAQDLGVTPAQLNPSLPPSPPAGEPFPQKGGSYGALECLPLPQVEEENNPNL